MGSNLSPSHLLCKRPQRQPDTYRDRIFKLSPMHASVIQRIQGKFCCISEKNPSMVRIHTWILPANVQMTKKYIFTDENCYSLITVTKGDTVYQVGMTEKITKSELQYDFLSGSCHIITIFLCIATRSASFLSHNYCRVSKFFLHLHVDLNRTFPIRICSMCRGWSLDIFQGPLLSTNQFHFLKTIITHLFPQ